MKEITRQVIGNGERGEVVLITFEESAAGDSGGVETHNRYVVRMGAFTMHDTDKKRDAENTAHALVR